MQAVGRRHWGVQTLEGHTDEIFRARSTTRVTASSREQGQHGSDLEDDEASDVRAIRCGPLMRRFHSYEYLTALARRLLLQ